MHIFVVMAGIPVAGLTIHSSTTEWIGTGSY